ncbi:hypothetical protein HZH66_012278 [Vespula vulgaris]|uniref:Uncharacterized protein n=1 Tax=Vespula vulgaris TaxID=7454 RepID=A0A834JC29_VESVU|nr:hypothetical protein HZH66_012278 [Vespula vulgaris]
MLILDKNRSVGEGGKGRGGEEKVEEEEEVAWIVVVFSWMQNRLGHEDNRSLFCTALNGPLPRIHPYLFKRYTHTHAYTSATAIPSANGRVTRSLRQKFAGSYDLAGERNSTT